MGGFSCLRAGYEGVIKRPKAALASPCLVSIHLPDGADNTPKVLSEPIATSAGDAGGRLADPNRRARPETALAAVRGRLRVEVCRITTPRAGARTTSQTSCTLRLGWM